MNNELNLARDIMLYLGDVVSGTEPGEDPRLDHVAAMIALASSAPERSGESADDWHAAVLAECMKIEAAYDSKDAAKTIADLIDWHVQEASGVAAGVKQMADNYTKLTCATAPTGESHGQVSDAADAWQPIATAPKDGTYVMLSNGVNVAQGWYEYEPPSIREQRDMAGVYIDQQEHDGYDGWLDCNGGMTPDPTHWQPLPASPAIQAKAGDLSTKKK